MIEIYRNRESAIIGLLAEQLEAAGIPTMIRNEALSIYPSSTFDPAVCVTNDADAERAREIVRNFLANSHAEVATERACPACGETSPGNFTECWKCGAALG